MWIPKNKKTGVEYPPITDAQKAEQEADHYIKSRYTFRQINDPKPPVERGNTTAKADTGKVMAKNTATPEPIEAKKLTPEPEAEREQ